MNAVSCAAAAEWLKLRSVRSTWWLAGGALLLMLLVAALEADGMASDLEAQGAEPGSVEAASTAVTASAWVRLVLGALGMLAMTSEYATRSIVVTLACTPSRGRLLLAKTAVVGAAVLAAGVLIAALGVAVTAPLLGEYGDFDPGQVGGQVLAIGAQLALIAVLALGIGALIRRSAGTLTVLFVLLLVLPQVLQQLAGVLDAGFLATAADYTPAPAGDRFMAGEPGFGLVLAAWGAATVAAAVWALRTRDA
jgi:ABC-2 type transport system permease protein